MDRVREFLEHCKQTGRASGNFLGLLNLLIGRRLTHPDGSPISTGLTWRELAGWLQRVRWPKDAVRELGLDPAALPPRDRYRYWYLAITHAEVGRREAVEAGDRLAELLRADGYTIGPPPGTPPGRSGAAPSSTQAG